MAKHSGHATLASYFAGRMETQDALAARCAKAGHPVSQAHLSRVAAGDTCSLDLAKLLHRLTGVPIESFGKRRKAVA